MSKKRGPYFNYKRKDGMLHRPRQTIWSQQRKIATASQLIFVPEYLSDSNDKNISDSTSTECMETDESIFCSKKEIDNEDDNFSNDKDCEGIFETNDYDLDDFLPLKTGSNCSKADAMLIIYAFAIRHNLNWKGLEDLVHLVNTLMNENVLPANKYIFNIFLYVYFVLNVIKRTTHFNCDFSCLICTASSWRCLRNK